MLRSEQKTPFKTVEAERQASRIGMMLFLLSLGVLFGATILVVAVMRVQLAAEGEWPDLPPLPISLLASTVVLAVSSVTVQSAVYAMRAGRTERARSMLLATAILGAVFLILQVVAWWTWQGGRAGEDLSLAARRLPQTAFYLLSGLHAAHVVGGLIALFTALHNRLRRTTEAAAMYWHFLGAVWLALYGLLLLGT